MNEHPGKPGMAIERVRLPMRHTRRHYAPPTAPFSEPQTTPPQRLNWRQWLNMQRMLHPWAFWSLVIAAVITFVYLTVLVFLPYLSEHRKPQLLVTVTVLFWFLAIGQIPIVAAWRTVKNVVEEIFDHD